MPAPWVMDILKNRRLMQEEHKAQAGEAWSNPMNLVFTNELGRNLIPQTVVRDFGVWDSKAPREEIMVSAETTQQTVLMRCSLRYSQSFTGNMNSILGTR